MPRAWFRLYRELISDRKVDRIAKATRQPRALIIGVWTTLLALACQSPQPGRLLLTETLPLTIEDLADETGLDADTLAPLLDHFADMQMTGRDGQVITITHWQERQFEADTSTERVRKHRAQQPCNANETSCNVSETLHDVSLKQCETPPDTESESDTESEAESDSDTEQTQSQTRAKRHRARAVAAAPTDAADVPAEELATTRAELDRAMNELTGMGIDPITCRQLLKTAPYAHILGWTAYADSQARLENPAGYVVKMLRQRAPPPPQSNRKPQKTWYTPEEYDQFFLHPTQGERDDQ